MVLFVLEIAALYYLVITLLRISSWYQRDENSWIVEQMLRSERIYSLVSKSFQITGKTIFSLVEDECLGDHSGACQTKMVLAERKSRDWHPAKTSHLDDQWRGGGHGLPKPLP